MPALKEVDQERRRNGELLQNGPQAGLHQDKVSTAAEHIHRPPNQSEYGVGVEGPGKEEGVEKAAMGEAFNWLDPKMRERNHSKIQRADVHSKSSWRGVSSTFKVRFTLNL